MAKKISIPYRTRTTYNLAQAEKHLAESHQTNSLNELFDNTYIDESTGILPIQIQNDQINLVQSKQSVQIINNEETQLTEVLNFEKEYDEFIKNLLQKELHTTLVSEIINIFNNYAVPNPEFENCINKLISQYYLTKKEETYE